MADISIFMPKLLQYAPNCPETSAYDAIRSASIEFCERTRLWRYSMSLTFSTSGTVSFSSIPDAVVHDIEKARWNGNIELLPASIDEVDSIYGVDWRDDAVAGQPGYFTQQNEDEITLVPFEAGILNLNVWLKPNQSTETIPDFIASRYLDVIQAGALYMILTLQNQPFYNPELAVSFRNKFEDRLFKLSKQQVSGQQRARLRIKSSYI